MPSLNMVGYIDSSIGSIVSQSLKEIEIICIDAGSTDGTVDVIERYAASDNRVRLIRCQQKSYGFQVNLGIRESHGKYIGIVESDDYVDLEMYQKLYEIAEENCCDYVKADYSAFISQDQNSTVFLERKSCIDETLYGRILCPSKHRKMVIGDWYDWSGIYNRAFIMDNDIWFNETPGAAFQDIGFLYKTQISAKRVVYIRNSFYRYRIDRDGSSSNSGKGLRYSYTEYFKLVETYLLPRKAGDLEIRLLFGRMAKSFISCYKDLSIEYLKEREGERRKYYNWFRDMLNSAINDGYLEEMDLNPGMWGNLCRLISSEKEYLDKICDADKRLKEMIGIRQKSPIVIFGAGDYGYSAYKTISILGYDVIAFGDNNSALWGKTIMGIPIMSPEKVANEYKTGVFIVANESYARQMCEQLICLGIPDKHIETYR